MRSAMSAASQLHEGEGQLVLMMLLHQHLIENMMMMLKYNWMLYRGY